MSPEPRLDEQVEAAIGLCGLRPDSKGDYQPAFAVYHVGAFVRDFLNGAALLLGNGDGTFGPATPAQPIDGPGHDRLAFSNWTNQVRYDNLRIWALEAAPPIKTSTAATK